MKCLLTILLIFSLGHVWSQSYNGPSVYGYRLEKDLVYGMSVNYTGATDTLKLDLYKPIGDHNPNRPLAVLVHGGSWLTGCKEDMAWLAKEMVGRGYAVAAVNYRLGWHKAASVAASCGTQDFPDFFPSSYDALYAADSCELIRAIYRGQQDVKGAIRWLKARHLADSTAVNAVLVGGESAGGFVSLAVGFIDRPEEKPDCCAVMPSAPEPSPNMLNLTTLNCVPKTWTINANTRLRPDLGDVDGSMNTGSGYNARVIGVINLFGGVPAIALTQNWLAGPSQPATYLYCQTCDAVVPSGYGQPFYPFSGICNTYANCSPWHQYTPHIYGSAAMAAYFNTLPTAPLHASELVYCDPFNSDLGILACLNFANNGGYHFVANKPVTAQNILNFFCPVVTAVIGGECTAGSKDPGVAGGIPATVYVSGNKLVVSMEGTSPAPVDFRLLDLSGRLIWTDQKNLLAGPNLLTDMSQMPAGLYVVQATAGGSCQVWKIIVH
jgi:alpha/beta superfamily hydrolase